MTYAFGLQQADSGDHADTRGHTKERRTEGRSGESEGAASVKDTTMSVAMRMKSDAAVASAQKICYLRMCTLLRWSCNRVVVFDVLGVLVLR